MDDDCRLDLMEDLSDFGFGCDVSIVIADGGGSVPVGAEVKHGDLSVVRFEKLIDNMVSEKATASNDEDVSERLFRLFRAHPTPVMLNESEGKSQSKWCVGRAWMIERMSASNRGSKESREHAQGWIAAIVISVPLGINIFNSFN